MHHRKKHSDHGWSLVSVHGFRAKQRMIQFMGGAKQKNDKI